MGIAAAHLAERRAHTVDQSGGARSQMEGAAVEIGRVFKVLVDVAHLLEEFAGVDSEPLPVGCGDDVFASADKELGL